MNNKNKKFFFAMGTALVVTIGSTVGLTVLNRNVDTDASYLKLDSQTNNKVSGLNALSDITAAQINMEKAKFVDPTSTSGTQNGSISNPYKTLAAAINDAQPGDTIYLRGSINESVSITNGGTDTAPITIRNYPGTTVEWRPKASDDPGYILELIAPNVNICGITFTGITEKRNYSAYGILMRPGSRNIVVQDCTFTNIMANGRDGNASCITLWGNNAAIPISNILIQNNTIHDNHLGWSECIAVNGNSQYVDVIGNNIYDNDNIGIDVQGQFKTCATESADYAKNVYVAENIVRNCISPIHDSAGIYVDGAQNVVVERNISTGSTIGIEVGEENRVSSSAYFTQNITVANNLIYGNSSYGLEIGGYDEDNNGTATNIKVYNNTVVNDASAAGNVLCLNRCSNVELVNNLFYDKGTCNYLIDQNIGIDAPTSNLTFKNNLFYHNNGQDFDGQKVLQINGTEYTLAEFEALAGNTNNVYPTSLADSDFATEYRLTEGNPAVDLGLTNATLASYLDLDGNTRTGYMDIGCYQLNVTTVDKTLLKNQIDRAGGLTETNYSSDSWSAMTDVLDDAQDVFDDSTVTQEQVDEMTELLKTAIDNLALDYTALDAELNASGNYNKMLYTEETYSVFETAVANGITVRSKELGEIYQPDIDNAATAIHTAAQNLVLKQGSINVTVAGHLNGDTSTPIPIEGVAYKLYKVSDECDTEEQAIAYIEANSVAPTTKTTNEDGVINFTTLEIGRYYAQVDTVPDTVTGTVENFIVNIPMTGDDGKTYIFDINVNPKVDFALANISFTKLDETSQPMSGVKFVMQKQNAQGDWATMQEDGADVVFTTDENGVITIRDLIQAKDGDTVTAYRLLETETADGYIIDNKALASKTFNLNIYNGKVLISNTESTFDSATRTTFVTLENEKPTVTKTVKSLQDGTFKKDVGVNTTDTLTYKVSVDVPTVIADLATFRVVDNFDGNVSASQAITDSLVVKGLKDGEYETITVSASNITTTNDEFAIDFNTADLVGYTNLEITYDVAAKDVVFTNGEYINNVTLEYSSNIDQNGNEIDTNELDDDARAHNGSVAIKKLDKKYNTPIQNAKFKIAASKAEAENGEFLKDVNGADIEIVTTAEGLAQIDGLAYGDEGQTTYYWLVETEAPTYEEEEDGQTVTKRYQLLDEPVKVQVNADSINNKVEILNARQLNLPATGGIGMIALVTLGSGLMIGSRLSRKKESEINE